MQYLNLRQFSQVKNDEIDKNVIKDLLKGFRINTLLTKKGIEKSKGVSTAELLENMFFILFQNKRSVSDALKHLDMTARKTILNDFLNNPHYNWRSMLFSVAKAYCQRYPHDEGKYSVLIIDDTSKKKSGRYVEGISWFYDHSQGSYFYGYQTVLAAISNGRTCVPIDLVLKTGQTRHKHAKRCVYPAGSHISKRVREARQKKGDISRAMISRALQRKFDFQYVLWDSWFNSSQSYKYAFKRLIPKGIHLISMVKQSNELYKYGDDYLNVKELQSEAGKWHTMDKTGIRYKSLQVEVYDKADDDKKVTGTVKLCFFKFPTKGKQQCRVLMSTDTTLTESEILERYMHRWSIEVMIKDIKQHFGYNQSMSSKYAPQLTDLTIKCMFYVMISSLKERNPEKSIQQLIFEFGRQVEDYLMELFLREYLKTNILDFLKLAEQKGLKLTTAIIHQYDDLIDEFLNRDYIDKITEVDIVKKQISA